MTKGSEGETRNIGLHSCQEPSIQCRAAENGKGKSQRRCPLFALARLSIAFSLMLSAPATAMSVCMYRSHHISLQTRHQLSRHESAPKLKGELERHSHGLVGRGPDSHVGPGFSAWQTSSGRIIKEPHGGGYVAW